MRLHIHVFSIYMHVGKVYYTYLSRMQYIHLYMYMHTCMTSVYDSILN